MCWKVWQSWQGCCWCFTWYSCNIEDTKYRAQTTPNLTWRSISSVPAADESVYPVCRSLGESRCGREYPITVFSTPSREYISQLWSVSWHTCVFRAQSQTKEDRVYGNYQRAIRKIGKQTDRGDGTSMVSNRSLKLVRLSRQQRRRFLQQTFIG